MPRNDDSNNFSIGWASAVANTLNNNINNLTITPIGSNHNPTGEPISLGDSSTLTIERATPVQTEPLCAHCGRSGRNRNMVEHEGNLYCRYYCYDDLFFECDCCKKRFEINKVDHKLNKFGNNVCITCINENYFTCAKCNTAYDFSDQAMDEHTGMFVDGYCQLCYLDDHMEKSNLNQWNYKPDPFFFGNGRYYGVEVEVDNGGAPNKLLGELLDISSVNEKTSQFIYFKHDGSLDNGFEIVSHPCDLNYHKNIINWDGVFNTLLEYNFTGNNNDTSGLHIHFGKNAFDNTVQLYRFFYIFKHFWKEIKRFSRRKPNEISDYTREVDGVIFGIDENAMFENKMSNGALESALRNMKNNQYDKYYAVNMNHQQTIEVRIFKSTLNRTVFLACIELVDAMIDLARDVNVDFRTVDWKWFVDNYCDKSGNESLMLYMHRVMPRVFS